MIKEEMKVGPKGQVVIPKVFRKILGIDPGSKVVIELEDNKILIEKPKKGVAEMYGEIAFSGKPARKIHPHYGYEESLKRWTKKVRK